MKHRMIALAMVLLCLTACTAQSFHVVGDDGYPDYRIFEFRDYSDQFSHTLELEAGDTVALDVIVRHGELDILVKSDQGDVIYQDDETSSGSSELTIQHPGTYEFTFTTVQASGNVTVTAIRAPQQEEPEQATEPIPTQLPQTVQLTVYVPKDDGTLECVTCDGIATAEGICDALRQAGVVGAEVTVNSLTTEIEPAATVYTLDLSGAFGDNATRLVVQCVVNTYLINLGGDQLLITVDGEALQTEQVQMDAPWLFSETVEEPTEPEESEEPEQQLSGPMLAITFDDGPSQYTKEILDLLETYDAKATFFVVGTRVDTYSETLSREIQLGCEVGNHTVNHVDLTKADEGTMAKEIADCNNSVCQNTGYTPSLLRPPYGSTSQSVRDQVGMPMILWSVDTRDWESRDADAVIEQVLGQVQDGDIILMHDLYGSTAEACKTIIPELIAQGYQLVTVSELAQAKGIDLEAGERYFSFH